MSDDKQILSEEILDKLRYFIEDNDPLRVSRKLRSVFFDYVRFQYTGLPTDFDEILNDVEHTIELMELLSEESKGWRNKLA